MKYKRIFALSLAAAMSLSACGAPQNSAGDVPVNGTEVESVAEPTEVEEVAQSAEMGTEKEAPEEVVESTEIPDTEVVESTEIVEEESTVESAFTVEAKSGKKYATQSVNVRKGPSTDYEKAGSLTWNEEITITG